MVLDMARPKYEREYHQAWNAWKRCCKKVDSQGEHGTGIHDRFLRDPVYRESQLAIGNGQNKSAKSGMNLQKKTTHTNSLQRKIKDTEDNGYLTLNKAGKNRLMKLRSDFRAAVLMKNRLGPRIRRTNWRASPSRSMKTMAFIFKHIVVWDKSWMELKVSS